MSSIAIITARGGSKRIPHKNIKFFCGRPIIAYSIEAALNSRIFDEVMVSTDDVKIAKIAKKYGAKIPFMRSEKNSDDYSGTSDVVLEVISEYFDLGKTFETICCIYPTAPFITANKLMVAYEYFNRKQVDALVPVVRYSYPPQRCFIKNGDVIAYKWPEYEDSRSQDLEFLYHDAGQFYFIKTEVLQKQKTMIPKNTSPFEVDELEVQDIDDITDWKLAEVKYKLMMGNKYDNSN